MSYALRKRVIELLEGCDCQEQPLEEHHLKLSDKPNGSTDLKIKYRGNEFQGWVHASGKKAQVVLFGEGDGVSSYVEEHCDANKEAIRECIRLVCQKLTASLN